MPTVDLRLGDCLDVLRTIPGGTFDAVVTDPPAGIGFMGKAWDHHKGGRAAWVAWLSERLAETLRASKPGAVMLCWSIPRTSHWTATAIEDAGWQIEDRLAHVFGSGFPKHKSKLKPAVEDWWLARKPGPKWLGVDACRVGIGPSDDIHAKNPHTVGTIGANGIYGDGQPTLYEVPAGRWPANLCLSHAPECNGHCVEGCPIRLMGEQGGERTTNPGTMRTDSGEGGYGRLPSRPSGTILSKGDTGTAARFFPNFAFDPDTIDPLFYCPKASRKDRGEGNAHPTVKPNALCRWLCRLACPPGGTIWDGFLGSGSTGKAAIEEGFNFIGAEQDPESFATARARIDAALAATPLFTESA